MGWGEGGTACMLIGRELEAGRNGSAVDWEDKERTRNDI